MERKRMRASAEVDARARELRKAMTPAEERLWYGLRGWKVGKFRRQHPIGRFVLDFYCAAGKLCVEVDGDVHDAQAERDAERTAMLNVAGIHVIRFRNDEVLRDTPRVLRLIEAELHRRVAAR